MTAGKSDQSASISVPDVQCEGTFNQNTGRQFLRKIVIHVFAGIARVFQQMSGVSYDRQRLPVKT
jgi:hypothetical protein